MRRRQFLNFSIGVAGIPSFAQKRATPIDESDPGNAKLCHRLDAKSITDDDLGFLRQIGLKWARLEFGEGQVTLDALRAEQQRFSQFGMGIYSGVHYSYRSRRVQLGEPGGPGHRDVPPVPPRPGELGNPDRVV